MVNKVSASEYDHLYISRHTHVLGVDITCFPRETAALMDGKEIQGGLTPEPELTTWTGGVVNSPHLRRDLAAWARRNLFSGATPGGDN